MKANYTSCAPIPAFIPHQLAIDILHNHAEVITANPLVIEHRPRTPPNQASSDELHSTWYDIVERIQYLPGLGKLGSGKITFPACFHNMPWGLQTHIYAPMGVDMRVDYRVEGEQIGVEPGAPRELRLAEVGAPLEGLYLRADVEFKASLAFSSFVRSQTRTALGIMVERVVKKAERMDASVLQGMIEQDRLRRKPTVRVPQTEEEQRRSQESLDAGGSPYLGLQQQRTRSPSTSALQETGVESTSQPATAPSASPYLGLPTASHQRSRSESAAPRLTQQQPPVQWQNSKRRCATPEPGPSNRQDYFISPCNPADYQVPWSTSAYAKLADVRPQVVVTGLPVDRFGATGPYDHFWSRNNQYGR